MSLGFVQVALQFTQPALPQLLCAWARRPHGSAAEF
jgi:hypothetical protein